jgi:redox-sensitive bicupin YhaK (pirin superfamily)
VVTGPCGCGEDAPRVRSRGYGGVVAEVWWSRDRYRGGDADAGIETLHAFSFGWHYDPDNVRFGALIACNEERLAPGAGFEEHPHRDMEIVTWVVEGELTHRDSTGRATVVRPGDLQRLSAGRGVRHVERNDAGKPLRFVQMWLVPTVPGGEPSYEVVRDVADGTPYVLKRADAVLHVRRLAAGERAAPARGVSRTQARGGRRIYVHVVRGDVRLGDEVLGPGDAVRTEAPYDLDMVAEAPAELLMWAM